MKNTEDSDFEKWLRERTRNLPEPEVSDEFLAAQRRGIYGRLGQPQPTWIPLRWSLSLAMTLLILAGGLTLELRHKAAIAVSPTISDEQLFSDLSAMEQSSEPYAWWSRPAIARDLNLSPAQRQQIRATVQQYRPHLMNVRAAVNQAEQALAEQFDRNPVDPAKTNEAIERLVDARSDLTRTLTQLSLEAALGSERATVARAAAPPPWPR